jgi:hypothetical protein
MPRALSSYKDFDLEIQNNGSYSVQVVVCNAAGTYPGCVRQYSRVEPNRTYKLGAGHAPGETYTSFTCKDPYYPNVASRGGALTGTFTRVPAY